MPCVLVHCVIYCTCMDFVFGISMTISAVMHDDNYHDIHDMISMLIYPYPWVLEYAYW